MSVRDRKRKHKLVIRPVILFKNAHFITLFSMMSNIFLYIQCYICSRAWAACDFISNLVISPMASAASYPVSPIYTLHEVSLDLGKREGVCGTIPCHPLCAYFARVNTPYKPKYNKRLGTNRQVYFSICTFTQTFM